MGQLVSTTLTALGYCHPESQDKVLYFKKLSDQATSPSRGSDLAAGYDLYSAENVIIPKQGKALVKTDIAIALPEGCYGRVAPRSSLSWKHHIDVGAGVVDRDYRGNVGVVLFNLSKTDYEVHHGDRIAQLIVERISTPPLVEVEELSDTARGTAGYGSTGK
ncbi:hypothetical protein ACROYT_G007652 [Oculina patagonica]